MRSFTLAAAAAAVAFAGVITTASTASADPNPPGCPPGAFCAYSGYGQTGSLLLKTYGNWSGNPIGGVHSVFNNGTVDPGADHVTLSWSYAGSINLGCFHYNPGPGHKSDFDGITIRTVQWRGECN